MDYIKILQKRKPFVPKIIQMFDDIGAPLPSVYIEKAGKIALLPTHIPSASSIDFQFFGTAKKMGLTPVWGGYTGDIYVTMNKRKTAYLKPYNKFGDEVILANPKDWEGKKLSEIRMLNGESLVDYHITNWQEAFANTNAVYVDETEWLKKFGNGTSEDYYYYIMLLYTFFGVKFWPANINALYRKGEKEVLLQKAMDPARLRIKKEFDLEPLEFYFELLPTTHL